jgi:hypothetical protein
VKLTRTRPRALVVLERHRSEWDEVYARQARSSLRSRIDRAVWATPRQPLSMIKEWPRPGISVISVGAFDRFWCSYAASAAQTDQGPVPIG